MWEKFVHEGLHKVAAERTKAVRQSSLNYWMTLTLRQAYPPFSPIHFFPPSLPLPLPLPLLARTGVAEIGKEIIIEITKDAHFQVIHATRRLQPRLVQSNFLIFAYFR